MATDSIEIIVPFGEEDSTDEITTETLLTMEPEKTNEEKKSKDNTLAIVLGTIGGLVIIAIVIIFLNKQKSKTKTTKKQSS